MIVLHKATHIYTDTDTNDVYKSTSSVINKFKQPFDPKGVILKASAAKAGVTPAALQAEWSAKAKKGCDFGTSIHDQLETYIKNYKTTPTPPADLALVFDHIKPNLGKCLSEHIVYDRLNKIAGTIDLVDLTQPKKADIYDFKTNNKFRYKSEYKTKLKPPLQHLDECEFTLYCLQISMYAYLLQKTLDVDIGTLQIVYLEYNNTKDTLTNVHVIPSIYMLNDIHKILDSIK